MRRFRVLALFLALAMGAGAIALAVNRADVPTLEADARAAWGEVLSQYRSRAEEVAPLVASLRTLAPGEAELWDEVAAAQAGAAEVPADQATLDERDRFRGFARAQIRLSVALGKLYDTLERYPEVRANSAFLGRLNALRAREDRVVLARRDFIAAARTHNRELEAVPDRWVAALFHPQARPFAAFQRPQLDRTMPEAVEGRL